MEFKHDIFGIVHQTMTDLKQEIDVDPIENDVDHEGIIDNGKIERDFIFHQIKNYFYGFVCFSKDNDGDHEDIEKIQQKENTNGNKSAIIIFFGNEFKLNNGNNKKKEIIHVFIIENNGFITNIK